VSGSRGGPAHVAVTGFGTATAPPDLVVLRVAAEVTAPQVAVALANASAAMDRMRQALLDSGVAAADLATTGVQVWPAFDHGSGRPQGYTATLTLTASVRDVRAAGPSLAAVSAAGGDATRVQDIGFSHSDPAALRRLARERAWADARDRAEQHAELAGRSLGAALRVEEIDSLPPVPLAASGAFGAMETRVAGPAVPIEPGSTAVAVRLEVRWELE